MSNQHKSNESQTNLGAIEISPDVIETISGIALSEIEGVIGTAGNWSSELNELLGQPTHKKGVYLTKDEHNKDLHVDVYIYLRLGTNVPKVVLKIQEHVKAQVLHMTDIEISEVNVHIVNLVDEKALKDKKAVEA